MPTALITGGAGFIGAHLGRAFLKEPTFADYKLVVLDDLSGGFRDNVPQEPRVEFVQGSVTDVDLINRLFGKHRFKYVYHLAAYAAEGLSHFIRRFNYTTNLVGSVNLLNAAVNFGSECFVFTSSIAVYGAGQVPMREDMVPQPEDPYGICKYAMELDLRAAHEMFGLNYVIFRPHNVYGEFQNIGDKYRNVVGIFMNHVMQGKAMTIFGDGNQQRAFSYVGDIASDIARAPLIPAAQNQVFNIGADQACTVKELAAEVAKVMDVKLNIAYLPSRQEVVNAYSDHTKWHQVFGQPRSTPLSAGLRRMAAWAKAVGARKSKEFDNIEVTKGLPPAWRIS
jgi:UDP-glucose 4-epimerase